METVNPHSLIDRCPKKIVVGEPLQTLYHTWKNLHIEMTEKEAQSFDAFIAGYYIGSNVMLKEKFLKLIRESKDLS